MKLAMIRVDAELAQDGLGAKILLQVHDELLLEVPDDRVDATRERVREAMEGVYPLKVPLVVDQKVGKNWRDV
jgi:DNA polymerase-1